VKCKIALELNSGLDVHKSVFRDVIAKVTNKMQLYRIIYYS